MVLPALPFPLRKSGVTVRYLPIIEYLSSHFELEIIVIDDINEQGSSGLHKYCKRYTVIQKPEKGRHHLVEKIKMNLLRILPWTPPYAFQYYSSARIKKEIIQFADKDYDAMIWASSNYYPFLPGLMKSIGIKGVVIDFIDSHHLIMSRLLSGAGGLNFFRRYEVWKMKVWETKVQQAVCQIIYISEIDASSANPSLYRAGGKINVIPNGVNIDDYSSETEIEYPGKTVGFLGNMSYGPNIEAVLWMYDNLREQLLGHDARLIVIGKDPVESIKKLADDPLVTVTGIVDNIWDHVNAVDVFVLPIFSGGGLKNKVLELMYAGKTVITTEIGNEGIDAVDGEHLYICNTLEEFKLRLDQLLKGDDCASICNGSNEFVKTKFDWQTINEKYLAIIDRCIDEQ